MYQYKKMSSDLIILIDECYDDLTNDYELENKEVIKSLPLSNSNQQLELEEDVFKFFEGYPNKKYSVKYEEKHYNIFDDINFVSKHKKNIELQITIKNSDSYIIINKIRLSQNIDKFIENCYITDNNKIIMNCNN